MPFQSGKGHNPLGTGQLCDSGSSWRRNLPGDSRAHVFRCVIVIPVVAIHTACIGMRPIQSIKIVVNREGGRFPARDSRVAHRAIRWNGQRHVVRIEACVEIRGVTAVTSVRRIG
jgi:hypothetical protein